MTSRRTVTIAAFLFAATLSAGTARADTVFSCTVTRVLEWADRVDVACSNTITANGGAVIQFFAIAKTDQDRANRWMSTASAALLSGKPFQVIFSDTATGNVQSCQSSNCRTPHTFGLQK